MTDAAQSYVDRYTEVKVQQLREIIEWLMLKYPHAPPHPETVEMFARGLLAAIDVSNARPEAYKDEPWREQGTQYHVDHCTNHAYSARQALLYGGDGNQWLADDGTPELAHAVVRGMMGLWRHEKGRNK